MKAHDPKGYYKVLGVTPAASGEAIKRAFRTVAKECHPDQNADVTAAAEFKRLVEAYSVLSDARNRAVYDGRPYDGPDERRAGGKGDRRQQAPPPEPDRPSQSGGPAQWGGPSQPGSSGKSGRPEPIQCSNCHRPTAQPRHATFWTVVSAGGTWRKRTTGIYCAACAGKVSLRCSAISAAFGWWGFLGVFWTPVSILRNARGGERREEEDAGLLWHNALAFLAQGKLAVAHALARQVASAKSINSLDASDMLAELHRVGVPRDTPSLVDPWRTRSSAMAVQLAMGLAAPVVSALAIAVYGVPTGAFATAAYASALAPIVPSSSGGHELLNAVAPRPTAAGEQILRAVTPQRLATCGKPPVDGQVLEGRVGDGKPGHQMVVVNGADGASIVKLRDATTDRVRLAFFVTKGGHATVGPVPDGAYHIQYAVGPALGEDCRSLASIDHAAEYPDTETFRKKVGDGGVVTQSLSYTLSAAGAAGTASGSGNVRPQAIASTRFLSD